MLVVFHNRPQHLKDRRVEHNHTHTTNSVPNTPGLHPSAIPPPLLMKSIAGIHHVKRPRPCKLWKVNAAEYFFYRFCIGTAYQLRLARTWTAL